MISMYKTPKTKSFYYQFQQLTYSQISNDLGKAKRYIKLRLHYKEAIVDFIGKTLKMLFNRQRTNGKWKVFITTIIQLAYLKMIEIYQIL